MSKALVPIFDEVAHTYTDPIEDFKYTSVTRWVEKFKPKFNELLMAEKIAGREGVSVDLVLEAWEKKRKDSSEFGTKIHKVLETYHSTGKIIFKEFSDTLNQFKLLKVKFDKKKCFFEKLVYNKSLKIAGTSDIIMHNSDKKTFNVFDFKTNKKLRYFSPFGDSMLKPLNHFPNSEYFNYSLQLSMYAYLYKLMSGLEPLRLKIFWYCREEPENYNNLKGEWKIVNVPYLEEEILKCLNSSKSNDS